MSLTTIKRYQWMIQKVQTAFQTDQETTLKCLKDNRKKIDAFYLDMKAPPKLFFFYQPRTYAKPELFVTHAGDAEKIKGKCLYFVRTSHKPVNMKVGADDAVITGELNGEILHNFEGTLSQIYGPLINKQGQDEWGGITQDLDKKQFLDRMREFDDDLKRKISNLKGDVELKTPEAPHDKIEQKPAAYDEAAQDPQIVKHFQGIVKSWCEVITKYMEDDPSNEPIDMKTCDMGPDREIEYWSRRMLTLISITEQLKTKQNRVVTGVLKARVAPHDKPLEEKMSDRDQEKEQKIKDNIKELIETWREVDLAITDALNEAKDNVRFLDNLRKVIEPLYIDEPAAIIDIMSALMNSMKMIHTLSRHYGTDVRMTNLFGLITNQLITRCKDDIYGGDGSNMGSVNQLWKSDPVVVIKKMEDSIKLCEAYRAHYRDTKEKLSDMPKGKQFNFDEQAIFGKFTRFRRRLEKLMDMFSSIQQFKALDEKHIDGMEKLIQSFDQLVGEFRMKNHDLLDFHNTVFERDFVEFTMHNSGLENAIQDFMERSLTQMSSIDKQLILMKKFQDILHREALQDDVEHKYLMIFKLYGEDLHHIQQVYDKNKDSPPIPRNMTRIAGNIHWSRQLLRRITSPMRKFQNNPKVFSPKDSKKVVRHYNKLARTLIEFETLWFHAWKQSTDAAKRGLRSRLIVADQKTGRLYVNFDHGVLQLMRESKHLQLMGFSIPRSARLVLLLEDKLKYYYSRIHATLERFNRVTDEVNPVCRSLLHPLFLDLERAIKPGMTSMTWTSMNIDTFLQDLDSVLNRFEFLVRQINDIIDNRVQKTLDYIASVLLLLLPDGHAFTLKDFVTAQKQHVERCTTVLQAKNKEVENAIRDLIQLVEDYPLHESIDPVHDTDKNFILLHYCHLTYHALLSATKSSLLHFKQRLTTTGNTLIGGVLHTALFELDISLQVPNVTVSPPLDDMHATINTVTREVLDMTQKINDWGLAATGVHRGPKPYYMKIANDRSLAVILLLLTGGIESMKSAATNHLIVYDRYAWLWTEDPEDAYNKFLKKEDRILEDFLSELHKFVTKEQEVMALNPIDTLGSLQLRTDTLKLQLKHEIERWKHQFSEKLHIEAKRDMESITDHMSDVYSKLEREVKDFASLKSVMDAQAEIRGMESWIDDNFRSIIERYNTLEHYLPPGVMTKDEMDAKSVLKSQWKSILEMSHKVMDNVAGLQGGFKQILLTNVVEFKTTMKQFRADYNDNGPMVEGISPQEAITRLLKYKREFVSLYRKYELYNGGEKLFGLPESKYPDLVKTKKELKLLDSLYGLYEDVLETVDKYNTIPWAEVVANIEEMNSIFEGLSGQCRRLPKGLKTWPAYTELSTSIDNFIEVLPLLTELSKPAMRDRHWKEISEKTGQEFDLEKFNELKLRDVLAANLLDYREDIEDITEAAEKQLSIEKKLYEIQGLWDATEFTFSTWKERGEVILAGESVSEVVEALEESQANLIQMLTQRHVKPFKESATAWLKKLSDVNDTLESWIKVQMLWMSLEAVFTGGDIARQMPQDTRVFMKVDKEWTTRMMNKSKEVKNVVECCQNEYIKMQLPTMFADLEKCQKALDGYLEAKRSKFPRFYFVSNPALLLILSQGSDKEAVQQCFSKVFDSIDRVEFAGNNIVKMRAMKSGFDGVMDSEDIPLTKPVTAKGNIEDWLQMLLKEMMRTVKDIVRAGANDFEAMPLPEFIAKYCAQITLLGIQFMWTSDVQEALIRTKHEKNSMAGALKKQSAVLGALSAMTTQDIKTKMERTKIETLVTIQVHQREVLETLVTRYKQKKLKDVYDFEWQKQLRCYWVPEDDDCVVKIADVDFHYCYEYLGCKERLVVTPLTDRCYISLSQAIGMCFGGAPAGPAGTGKTETVKDLARGLGKLVVVFNCSDQMHTADTAKIYKGLCQSGSWGCFDEFNRIDLEVLSVVAQQVQAILTAMRERNDKFSFPGDDIGEVTLDTRCGFFITMNPGYAGRQELPENLKALFRGVAMMVPDREIIIRVKLASVGYIDFPILSKKFRVLYGLCEEQLSKQRHYDFGLRNILSVLRTAGVNLRIELNKDAAPDRSNLEEMLMMRTLRDMNLSKLVTDDVPLFISLLHDLFPNQRDPDKRRYDEEEEAMAEVIKEWKLVQHDSWVTKAVQLYETSLVRHGLMMCGPAGGGKSKATAVLLEALTIVKEKHMMVRMNPKAILAEEMFGQNDAISGEWTHGIFSSLWQKYNDVKKNNCWIVCDGPVDAIWIENLNTVLDDNKLLTLANGDRIPMTDNVRLLFEVEDLRNASPATVSRAGIIYVGGSDLGHEPIVEAWMRSRRDTQSEILRELYKKLIVEPNILEFVIRSCRCMMVVTPAHLMSNCLALLDGMLAPGEKNLEDYDEDQLERCMTYCIMWSIGGLLEQDDREKLNEFICNLIPGNLPEFEEGETVYEFALSEDFTWERWLADEWEYEHESFSFTRCLIPTVDSVRAQFLIGTLLQPEILKPILLIGSSGTAKTSIVLQYCQQEEEENDLLLKKVNFSSATTAGMFQTSVEADIEKRQGKTYAPPGGRNMTIFLDDLSMPEVNKWGDQPTLEIVRQLIESGGFYFLEKDKRGDKMIIENVVFIGAMSHPGGGRNDIPNRLKRHFFCFNMTPPSFESIDNIYGSMLRGRYEHRDAFFNMVNSFTAATIDLWQWVKNRMLPTPSKFHYIFNMRDLSRVFQGLLFVPNEVIADQTVLVKLWKHECERVFSDRLTNFDDIKSFKAAHKKILKEHFEEFVDEIYDHEMKERTYFVDFLRDAKIDEETDEILEEAPKIYELVPSVADLKVRVNNFLQEYNESGLRPMHLVLFTDALEHMMRISRIIGMPRGNALLVGVGGSGRQSLTKLAAFIGRQTVFSITITRTYKVADFLEDIRQLYVLVGKEGQKVTWLVNDFEIIYEDFLEYINAILATGEVAGLFAKDERDMMCSDLRSAAKADIPDFEDTMDNLYKYFLDRIRDNLHIVLSFSPANEKFAERARRFPGLISGCIIDWFLRWPEEALVDVSRKFISHSEGFKVMTEPKTEQQLVKHIAKVHDIVTEACEEYFNQYRRRVFVTPKSYLSFIASYQQIYQEKLKGIEVLQRNVSMGLRKLEEAEDDVDKLKVELQEQNVELKIAEKNATAMLDKLEIGAAEAGVKKAAADAIEEKCKQTSEQINKEREVANKELEAAMPFVRAAEAAAAEVNKKDIGIIQKLGKPPDLIKRIMDCVLILNLRKLDKVSMTQIKVAKNDFQDFVMDSYDSYAKKMMVESGFVSMLLEFAAEEKDNINEETMEFLEPYLTCPDFNAERAKTVASAAYSLCKWVRAMASYHEASLIVGPKLEELNIKTSQYEVAMQKLAGAKEQSAAAQAEVDRLQASFQATMAEKAALEAKAQQTADKMTAANALIKSLSGEKTRWANDALVFADDKKKLVGDCALACAFFSYLGPFNHEFRRQLMEQSFYKDCKEKKIPISKDLNVNLFLVDEGTIAQWNSQSLPKDDLSIQNGILVTQASRYPLLIDPQGQAINWLKMKDADDFPLWGTTSLSNSKLRDQVKFCMENGKSFIIEGIVKDVDPMLDPILDKNIISKGRNKYILMGEETVPIDPNFRMYLITKLNNPLFSPELSAKTTIIDFSVTQKGLEDQLLSRVIQQEQKSLEDQRSKLIEEVNQNTISLQNLDKELLDRLSASQGNLLDDVALIRVLSDTKTKAAEVKEKIEMSKETEQIINKKREQYRPVATRGSVIYFVIVTMALVNCMYQISLAQFLTWFDNALATAEEANLVAKRVQILMQHLTYTTYINTDRGLFECDKLTFKLMVAMRMLMTEHDNVLTQDMVTVLLRGGMILGPEEVPRKPFDWLQPQAWMNVCAVAQSLDFFSNLRGAVEQNELEWKRWYEAEDPETMEIPGVGDRLDTHPSGPFMRLLLIRSFRDDRTRLACQSFIESVMGSRYIEPVPTRLEDIWDVSDQFQPIVMLLTPGADPTAQLEELAKKKGVKIYAVSMGEGQEPHAERAIDMGMEEGGWALLQNCHLGLGFISELDEALLTAREEKEIDPAFRLWITCEPHPEFSISLLQMSIKVTNEPPQGMKAGLLRSYTGIVSAERLARVETKEWRDLVYTICFLHSVVQERRKFGPVGWCIPYEFNDGDLEASLMFLEKHSFTSQGLSWPTVQYMICEVQYGGRITDDFDRLLFNAFGHAWLTPDLLRDDFNFFENDIFSYKVFKSETIDEYHKYIQSFPSHDTPEIFGLHPNADLTYGANQASYLLNTINDTQPKASSSKSGMTREETVEQKAAELLKDLPVGYKDDEVRDLVQKRPAREIEFVLNEKPEGPVNGFTIPLNVTLYQEIARLDKIITTVRRTLEDLIQAINGEIIMTPQLQDALNSVFDAKPPHHWHHDPSGAQIAWIVPSLSLWFSGLLDRERQLTQWLTTTRPTVYWLTGFFNPQGFLTATRQEVTRRHKAEKWALDDVVVVTEVKNVLDPRRIREPPEEGVYIHGLFLEGCSWGPSEKDKKERVLLPSNPKELFVPMPVIRVGAATSERARKIYAKTDGFRYYDCPVYTMPRRTDLCYVFQVKLKTDRPDTGWWVLRGVALLCSKD